MRATGPDGFHEEDHGLESPCILDPAAPMVGAGHCPGRPAHRRILVDPVRRKLEVPDNPQRVVALAPGITGIVYALGQQGRLKGVSGFSDYPPAASGPISHQEHGAIRESVPLYDRNPPPVYPRVARRRNYQGTVLLDVRVSADGTVAEVKVAHSSGYSVLDRSALSSVRHRLFEPARRGSRPIETWVPVPVRFELD
jgi:TonB family protein